MRMVRLKDAPLTGQENRALDALFERLWSSGSDEQVLLLASFVSGTEQCDAALHLGRFLAGRGQKVLLLDADLRRSMLLSRLIRGDEEMLGLSHFLTGQASLKEILCASDVPGLQLICAGPRPSDPTELLSSRRFEAMVDALRDHYDYILVNSASLGVVIDAAITAKLCDGALLLGQAGRGASGYGDSALDQIEKVGCPILGRLPMPAPAGSDMQSSRGRDARGDRFEGEDIVSGAKKKKKSKFRPGYVIIGVLAVLALTLLVLLAMTKMLPGKYLAVAGAVLLLLVALMGLLVWDTRKRGLFGTGTVLSVVLAAVLLMGCVAVGKGLSTLGAITTGGRTRVSHIGVYVAANDPAEKLGDLADYDFGILQVQDRTSVDRALSDIGLALNKEVPVTEYAGLSQMVDALESDQVEAIVFNVAHLDMLEELEGYENVEDRIREITVMTVEDETPEEKPVEKKEAGEPFTMYISGVDSRVGLYETSRSDVNILATVNPATRQVLLVSTPRDYFVPLSISDGVRDKLTHAGIYGVDVSMDTLGMLYGIDVDYYFKVSFGGFKDIVDALGGITVNSEYEFSTNEGYYFNEGENYLYGDAALAFARERYAFASGDNQRGRNQMAVIRGIIAKASSVEVLTNYLSLMDAAAGNFETSMPADMIGELVQDQLTNGGGWNVVSYSVTGTGDSQVTYSQGVEAYVMWPDESTVETAKDLMARVRNGETVTAP